MATRRTPQGRPRRGSRRDQVQRNIRPGARGTDRARATEATAAARPRFTNRMAILVLVLAVLVVSYASSMRAYLQQRSHINDLRAQIDSSERDIKALEREKRRWADDAYVETQARERFGWVMPGETSYQVIDRDGKPLERGDELTDPSSVARTRARPVVGQGLRDARGGRPPRRRRRRRRRGSPPPPTPTPDARPVTASADTGTRAVVAAQLGRPPRSIHAVGHRCPCGNPDVVATEPRLDDGTPFPTTFYLTCPRAASRIGTLEASGLMREMTERLGAGRGARGGVPAGARGLPRRARRDRRGARDRGRLRRRHARPGQVPARARRPVAGPGPRA